MKLRHLAAALVLVAAPCLAAEGGRSAEASFSSAAGETVAFFLCDGDHSAGTACAEFDLKNIPGSTPSQRRTAPDQIQFMLSFQSTSCTPTVTVRGMDQPNRTGQVKHNIQDLSAAGVSSLSLGQPSLFRVYDATVTVDADCTDLEVLVVLFYKAI